jgi:hypothetical protein
MRGPSFTSPSNDQVRAPGSGRYVKQPLLLREDSPSFSHRTSEVKGDVQYETGKTAALGHPWSGGTQESAEEFADPGSSR